MFVCFLSYELTCLKSLIMFVHTQHLFLNIYVVHVPYNINLLGNEHAKFIYFLSYDINSTTHNVRIKYKFRRLVFTVSCTSDT